MKWVAYTDGACAPSNPGPSGWGAVIIAPGEGGETGIMEEEEIMMELTSNVSPCVIKNVEENNCKYLILPVRLLNS